MIASVGANLNPVSIHARRVHTQLSLRIYHHKRNVHKYDVYRLHHRKQIYSLEKRLVTYRLNQVNHYLKKSYYPQLRREQAKDPKDENYTHGETWFKVDPKSLAYGGHQSSDVSEDANAKYFNKRKFIKNYIKGLTNYYYYAKRYIIGPNNRYNDALDCGYFDANFYASRLVTERYARQHHMSHKWLKTNLNHYFYGLYCNKGGTGANNFMSGAELTPVIARNRHDIRTEFQIAGSAASHQYKASLKYSYKMKPRYYRLRKPSLHELNYLKNSHYVHYKYSNLGIQEKPSD